MIYTTLSESALEERNYVSVPCGPHIEVVFLASL